MAEVNQVLTLPQIKKMKVAELRERLQKLDKPTTGLKPELVSRLFDALFEAQKQEVLKNLKTTPATAAEQVTFGESNEAPREVKESEAAEQTGDETEEEEESIAFPVVQSKAPELKTTVTLQQTPPNKDTAAPVEATVAKMKEPEVTVSETIKEKRKERDVEEKVPVIESKTAEFRENTVPTLKIHIKPPIADIVAPVKEKVAVVDKKELEVKVSEAIQEEPEKKVNEDTVPVIEPKTAEQKVKLEVIEERHEEKEKVMDAVIESKLSDQKVKVSEIIEEKREEKKKEDVVPVIEMTTSEQMEVEPLEQKPPQEEIVAPIEEKAAAVQIKEPEVITSETVQQKHEEKEKEEKVPVIETKIPELKEKETLPPKPPKERKRRWGSTSTSSSNVYTKGISSDAIKEMLPDLNKSIAKVSTKTDDTVNTKITPNITKLNNSTNQTGIGQSNSEATVNRGTNGVIETKRTDEKRLQKSHSVSEDIGKTSAPEHLEGEEIKRRSSTPALKETKADETIETKKAPSPAHNAPSNIVFIRNLVRPFTLLQLKEILGKNGKINEEKFWIDKIKSKCYVAYETQEAAANARESLHGLRWPEANPKTLVVDFATLDELEYHLNLEKGIVPQANPPEQPKPEIKRQTEAPKATSKDKYDIVIRRERHDEKERPAKDDKKDIRKDDHKREDVKVEKRPIREWDREKLLRKDNGESSSPTKRKRSASHSPRRGEGDVRIRDKERARDTKSDQRQREKAPETESPANLLDGLFKKTKATPCIYWLPLTEDQAKKRAEERIETERRRNEERVAREAERKKRIEEMNRSRRPSPPVRRDTISPRRGRGSYASRRPPPPRFRNRRHRSGSDSESSSRSRSRSRSRGRSISRSRSRSRSRSPPRKRSPLRRSRSRSRTPPRRSPRRSPRRR